MQSHYAKLLRVALTASLMLVAVAGTAVAGQLEDAAAAREAGYFTFAVKLYGPLAEQGDVRAQNGLGALYDNGLGVPRRDSSEAVKWYRRAAEKGYAPAQANLCGTYFMGRGVSRDYAEAVKWCVRDAEQNDANGQSLLGNMYANGIGVPQDYVEGYKWLTLAAEQSFPDAIATRDTLASKMTPIQIAEAWTLARNWRPKPEQ